MLLALCFLMLAFLRLSYSSSLKIVAVCSFETLVKFYRTMVLHVFIAIRISNPVGASPLARNKERKLNTKFWRRSVGRSVGRINCCWPSPAQSLLFRRPAGLTTRTLLSHECVNRAGRMSVATLWGRFFRNNSKRFTILISILKE
jgi:hypothetical protein